MKFVEQLVSVQPFKLTLRFNTGEVRVADLEPMLRTRAVSPQSAYARLLEPATFLRARLDPEGRTVCWDGLAVEVGADGIEKAAPLDFCPDVLYELSSPLVENEIDQAEKGRYPTQISGFILKDEPMEGE